MIIHDTARNIFQQLSALYPGALAAFERSKTIKPGLLGYQALALFALATRYDRPGARILELGTAVGYSASLLAQGAPRAQIVTLNPRTGELPLARQNLRPFANVTLLERYSWDHLAQTPAGVVLDMVFVDGDHNHIARDLPWFNHLAIGGLLLCHDYTPLGGRKPSPIIYAELNHLAEKLGRPFDVSVIDESQVGMAGFYRRAGETL